MNMESLPEWTKKGAALERSIEFPSFLEALAFVNAVAALAEARQHHPDIDIRYRRVKLTLTTHDVGALTERDFQLAEEIDALLASGEGA